MSHVNRDWLNSLTDEMGVVKNLEQYTDEELLHLDFLIRVETESRDDKFIEQVNRKID